MGGGLCVPALCWGIWWRCKFACYLHYRLCTCFHGEVVNEIGALLIAYDLIASVDKTVQQTERINVILIL